MAIVQEFKKFAIKGNAIDLAVGVVIGAAFGKIVTSMVEDIINPIIGLIIGRIDLSNMVLPLGTSESILRYGAFITNLINFFIVAFAIFLVVKQINRFKDREEKTPSETPKVSDEVRVLTEIKDLLSNK